jgi:predicted ATPase
LTGAGGVGKTRLALQAARQVAPRFGDGAWLCDLTPVRDPTAADCGCRGVCGDRPGRPEH